MSGFKAIKEGKYYTWRDDYVHAVLCVQEATRTVKDTNVPNLEDVVDPELLADNIPHLQGLYKAKLAQWETWQSQGWYPRSEPFEKYFITITYDRGGSVLSGDSVDRAYTWEGLVPASTMEEALVTARTAIKEIKNGEPRPTWLSLSL